MPINWDLPRLATYDQSGWPDADTAALSHVCCRQVAVTVALTLTLAGSRPHCSALLRLPPASASSAAAAAAATADTSHCQVE